MDIEPTRYISLFICSPITNNRQSINLYNLIVCTRKAILNLHEKQLTQFFFAAL